MADPLWVLSEPPFRPVDYLTKIYLSGQLSSLSHHPSHLRWHRSLPLLKGASWAALNLRDFLISFGWRVDRLWGYCPIERGFDRGWDGSSRGCRCVGISSGRKKDEAGSRAHPVYFPGLLHCWIGADHPFLPLPKTLLWIFPIHLSPLLPAGPRSPVDRTHHIQLGLAIPTRIYGGHHHFRGTNCIYDPGLLYPGRRINHLEGLRRHFDLHRNLDWYPVSP